MSIKDRVVEIAYRLRDEFTGKVSQVVSSIEKVDHASVSSSKGVTRLSNAFTMLGRSVKVASTALAATLVGALIALAAKLVSVITSLGDFSSELDKTAKAARSLGETTEQMTALQYAAELSGLSTTQLQKGMQQMVRTASEAADGIGKAAEAYGELGLNATEMEQLSPGEQLAKIADALQDIQSQADKVRLAEALFGARNASSFLNLLEKGSQGLKEMTDAAKEMGRVFSSSEAAKVEEFNDRLTTLGAKLSANMKKAKLAIIEAGNAALNAFGIDPGTGNKLKDLDSQIARIEERLGRIRGMPKVLQSLLSGISDSDLQKLKKLTEERDRLLSRKKAEKLAREREQAEREHNRKMAQLYKEGVDGFKKALAERKRAYQKSLGELKALQGEEKSVAQEFAKFVQDVQSGSSGNTKTTFFDASLTKSEAQQALDAGNFQQALEKARAAKEMVEQLKTKGEDSTVSLLGLAKSIERIANAAAKGKVDAKQGEVDQQKKLIDDIEARLKNLPKIKVSFDDEALKAEMDRIQKMLDERQFTVQVKTSESVAGYGGQTDIERALKKAALQRGDVR